MVRRNSDFLFKLDIYVCRIAVEYPSRICVSKFGKTSYDILTDVSFWMLVRQEYF
jgi:hypothetical protein